MDMDDNDDLPNVETDGPLNNEAVESYAREVTYEEICRAHVESCFEASASYQARKTRARMRPASRPD